ncbi:MAG: hypothetical protein JMDDDDMK_05394 [Acidobacteria bacterium]|nr:hypothetical protein [Acidobacteriota bacterium]
MSKRALKLVGLSLACAAVLAVAALAQNSAVEGTYNVSATSAELGTINFVLVIKRDAGKWTAEVKDSPTPLTVTNVTVDDAGKITITADAGGTAVTILGKYDSGAVAGDWSAGDIKGTWKGAKKDAVVAEAKPADKPAASSAGAAAGIEGIYDAKVIAEGQGELPFTLIIKRDGDKLVTLVENGGDLNIVSVEVKEGDAVTLSATFQGNPFQLPGKRTGAEMGGKWEAGGFSGTWSAKKK